MGEIKDAVLVAARRWWRMKRPVRWTHEQHIAKPQVNCVADAEKLLATAVAKSYVEWPHG